MDEGPELLGAVLLSIAFFLIGVFVGVFVGYSGAKEKIRKEAIDRGFACYEVNPHNGRSWFAWRDGAVIRDTFEGGSTIESHKER